METQITIDLVLIARSFTALLWGVLWALALQHSRLGRFLARERTWIAVVIGVGVDLLLGIGALWWQIWLVVALSSIGIIARSLLNEHREVEPALNRYKAKWALEDCIDRVGDVVRCLEHSLESEDAERLASISQALTAAHAAGERVNWARYESGKAR